MTDRRLKLAEQLADEIAAHKIRDLGRKVVALLGRDVYTTRPDGFSAGHAGGGSAPTASSSSPVEAAMLARMTPQRDAVRADAGEALVILRNVADGLRRLDAILRFYALGVDAPLPCETHRSAGIPETATRTVEMGDRVANVCQPCRDYYRRAGVLPTADKVRRHAECGRFD